MQESQTNSGFRQKIGSLLQNLGGRGTSSRPEEPPKPDQKAFLTEDALKELGPDTPLPIRLKTIKELQEIVATKRLEQYAIQTLWVVLKDLLESSKPTEARHVVLGFLRALIEGQYEDLGILRAHFLRVIQTHSNIEDFQPCFDILCSLTDNGKDVKYIEQDIGPYLADILANATSYGRCIEYLTLLINLLKHNTSYIEEEQLTKFIHGCCELVLTNSNDLHVSELSLDALNTVICYSYIPLSSLLDVTTTLCHSINVTPLQRQSLEIMLRLLGTHVGHSAIFTICSILQNRDNWTNALLLRGAVFSVSVSLWSSQRVESLKISFSSVLPFIQEVSTCQHIIVLYEISLSLLRLVTEYGQTLHSNEWNCLYVIFENVQDHLIHMKRDISESSVMLQVFQEIFDKMASLHHDHAHQATMDVDKFFDVVNKGINLHQLSLIMKLLVHEVGRVRVGSSKWVEHLLNVMERFYHFRMVTSIRLLVLDLLQELLINHLYCYEKELLEGVVFPLLHPVADDSDEDVCCRAVQLLIVVLNESSPDWAPPILGIINSVFQKGLQMVALKKVDKDEMKLLASKAAVFGLTPLFKAKLNSCCDVSAQVFYLLVNYLQQQMEENHFVPATCVIRIKIFNCILSLRANEDGFVGYFDENKTTFSPFFVCEKQILVTDDQEQPDEEFSLPVVYLNSTKVFSAVLCCLTKEREWTVLVEMLLGLNRILADRKLTLSASPQLGELCQKLCHIADNCQRWIDKLHNVPSRPNDSLAVYLYPVLATLCTYGDYLDRAAQNSLICSLERGVVGTCSLLCVKALNVATLEMQMMMSRLLPRVLYRIGQVAATPTMAVPVLELLANIIGFPLLYNGFVDQQYLGVFGIAIPYTDPSK
jgi:tuberous sclerosis protein 2